MLKIKSKRQGAELTSILKDGNEMLFDGKTFWNRQSPILFPIVGQIKEGKTQIEGKIYEMSQHGFARDMEFQEIEENHYILKYNEQTLKKYPYKFELHVIYKIVEDALQVTYEVKNIDNKKIYFGIGGHPAFKCDYSTGDYEIVFEQNEEKKKRAVRFDLMLHAYMMVQSGIPMLYSGDEIGQVNDYTYKNDPEKRVDSRYIHRGKFDWKLADGRKRKGTVQKELFDGIGKLRSIRSKEKVFDASANVWTLDTWENGILGVVRELEGEQMTALFNFAEEDRTAWIEEEGEYMDLYTGKKVSLQAIKMEGHSFVLAKKC